MPSLLSLKTTGVIIKLRIPTRAFTEFSSAFIHSEYILCLNDQFFFKDPCSLRLSFLVLPMNSLHVSANSTLCYVLK